MKKLYQVYVSYRRTVAIFLLAVLAVFAWGSLLWEVPAEIYVTKGQQPKLEEKIPVSLQQEETEAVFSDRWRNKYQVTCSFLGLFPIKTVTVHVVEQQQVYAGGQTAGIFFHTDGIYVVDIDEVETLTGEYASPCDKKLHSGDYIVAVNGQSITEKEQLMEAVENSQGEELELTVRRNGRQQQMKVRPVQGCNREYKLGVWVKDDLAGVGTISYIDEEGNYGALGHGISSSDSEKMLEVSYGKLFQTEIAAVNKGEKGTPGSLVGLLYFQSDYYLGSIDDNSNIGIYGCLSNGAMEDISDTQPMIPVGYKQEIHRGDAQILCSLEGMVTSYDIQIEDVAMNSPTLNKSMMIRVTDPELLAKTGGIVQGMSGSPIIQDGKIVGAVTHVLVNDPTRGYGIFIETMLHHP